MPVEKMKAEEQIGEMLGKIPGHSDFILFASSPEAAVIAHYVSGKLDIPWVYYPYRLVGHPDNKEYSIGAASLDQRIINTGAYVSPHYINEECARLRVEMDREAEELGNKRSVSSFRKKIILVDDGHTCHTALLLLADMLKRQYPELLYVATPALNPAAAPRLEEKFDKIICLGSSGG
jgi:putative phosphoribosyl transferase